MCVGGTNSRLVLRGLQDVEMLRHTPAVLYPLPLPTPLPTLPCSSNTYHMLEKYVLLSGRPKPTTGRFNIVDLNVYVGETNNRHVLPLVSRRRNALTHDGQVVMMILAHAPRSGVTRRQQKLMSKLMSKYVLLSQYELFPYRSPPTYTNAS